MVSGGQGIGRRDASPQKTVSGLALTDTGIYRMEGSSGWNRSVNSQGMVTFAFRLSLVGCRRMSSGNLHHDGWTPGRYGLSCLRLPHNFCAGSSVLGFGDTGSLSEDVIWLRHYQLAPIHPYRGSRSYRPLTPQHYPYHSFFQGDAQFGS